MEPNMIPISTARWDPKWFNAGIGQGHVFIDKNGVLNGLRATPFAPHSSLARYCADCLQQHPPCDFLAEYTKQLDSLDSTDIFNRFKRLEEMARARLGLSGEVTFILLVHEAPCNPCSER